MSISISIENSSRGSGKWKKSPDNDGGVKTGTRRTNSRKSIFIRTKLGWIRWPGGSKRIEARARQRIERLKRCTREKERGRERCSMPSCVNPNHKLVRCAGVGAHGCTKLIKFGRLIRLFVSLAVDFEIHLEEQETNDSPLYRSTNERTTILFSKNY